jgi:Flp pilus assembly protein TadG
MVLVALSMTMLIGMLGLAVDVGLLFNAKRKAQLSADSAAIAGAAELNFGDYASAAQAVAAENGFTNGVNGVTVSVNPSGTSTPSPQTGMYANKSGYLEVVISASEPTYFMRVLGFTSMTVKARAVATLGSSDSCIYVLAINGTSLSLSNNAQLTSTSCGIMVDSNSGSAVSVSGSANIKASSMGVVGSTYTDNSGSKITPTPTTGIAPFSDPLAYLSPPSYTPSSCTADPLSHYGNGGSSYSVGPGSTYSTTQSGNVVCYTSLTLGWNNDTVTINPGTYVITGPMTFASGTVQGGDGVTFYLTGTGSVNIGNGANFTLTAPTSGTYDGILFYQNPSDTLAASIQGGANSTFSGILYFPAASLTIGNGTTSTVAAQMVAKTVTMVGGSTLINNSYSAINSSTPLASARLVE